MEGATQSVALWWQSARPVLVLHSSVECVVSFRHTLLSVTDIRRKNCARHGFRAVRARSRRAAAWQGAPRDSVGFYIPGLDVVGAWPQLARLVTRSLAVCPALVVPAVC